MGRRKNGRNEGPSRRLTGVFVGVEEFAPDNRLGSDVWSEEANSASSQTKTENTRPQTKKDDKEAKNSNQRQRKNERRVVRRENQ